MCSSDLHREAIQSQLEGRLGRKVTFGDMSLQLSPFGIRVADIAIAEDPAIGSSNFIHADALEVRAELWPLLQGRVNLDAVVLRRPIVELVRTAAGQWNFAKGCFMLWRRQQTSSPPRFTTQRAQPG